MNTIYTELLVTGFLAFGIGAASTFVPAAIVKLLQKLHNAI